MEKKELKEEIKKVLEGKSIYGVSPISGLNPMTKEEIIYWIVETYIDQELDKARREYFSMGMEYFSLIDDSNIYQKKGWKLSEEKAERLQILDKMFNLLKDNK